MLERYAPAVLDQIFMLGSRWLGIAVVGTEIGLLDQKQVGAYGAVVACDAQFVPGCGF